jgi:2-amino-4-hydroxy-6-hydroxymethyldihydropteridine diphosphokinase
MQAEEMVFIALGSNLGDREGYLASGRKALAQVMKIEQISSIYETPPWGVMDQPKYLNQVIQGCTTLNPMELLIFLKKKEQTAGRVEGIRFGPRVLDMDILFYGQEIVEMDELQIPHPRLQERAFVLVPMNEIAPNWIHPIKGLTISELLLSCPSWEEIKHYE